MSTVKNNSIAPAIVEYPVMQCLIGTFTNGEITRVSASGSTSIMLHFWPMDVDASKPKLQAYKRANGSVGYNPMRPIVVPMSQAEHIIEAIGDEFEEGFDLNQWFIENEMQPYRPVVQERESEPWYEGQSPKNNGNGVDLKSINGNPIYRQVLLVENNDQEVKEMRVKAASANATAAPAVPLTPAEKKALANKAAAALKNNK